MQVSILIPQQGALLNSIERLFNIFNYANEFAATTKKTPFFKLQLVAADNRVVLHAGYTIAPGTRTDDAADSDLIMIPALAGDIENGIKDNNVFYSFIKDQYGKGACIAALCTGAFLLKKMDFADDPDCQMRWFADETFRRQYTQVSAATASLMKRETIVYNKKGAYAFIDDVLRTQAGLQTAAYNAEYFEQDFNTECQSLISISNKKANPYFINSNTFLTPNPQPPATTKQSFAALFNLEYTGNSDEHVQKETIVKARNKKALRQLLKK